MNDDTEEYIKLNDLLKDNLEIASRYETNLLFNNSIDDLNDSTNNLYQVQGIDDTQNIILKHIGNSSERPTILVSQFKFKKIKCKLISYILNNADIEEANETCKLKILSLNMEKKNNTIGVLALEYHTFDHKKNKTHLFEHVTQADSLNSKELTGFYAVYFKRYNKDKLEITKLEILKEKWKKSKASYILIKYLSHPCVSDIIKLY